MNIKKIYSLNLMGYLQMVTGQKPKLNYEFDNVKGSKWYGVFEDTDGTIDKAIGRYKDSEPLIVDLHDYLRNLKDVIDRKNKIQGSVREWNNQ